MKYCKKCGMLLEDTQEICIGCGTDVSEPENTSIFPPEVAEKMESRKAQEKKKNSIIIAIVIVFILLAVLIGVIAVVASKSASGGAVSSRDRHNKETSADNEASADAGASAVSETDTDADADPESAESSAETAEEPAEAEAVEEDKPVDNRKVSDAQGNYYNVGEVYDEAGMLMFTTLYPEDFGDGEPTVNFDYTRYS
ncbi:MAG: hypothetical protein K5770_00605, partial [Lachnospiraceae bacterium]|nr:hypothetical protein [Lachnospiraceae bacterium]